MNMLRRFFFRLVVCLPLLAIVGATAMFAAAPAASDPDGDLKLVIILTRHGVRSPLATQTSLDRFSAEAWPRWDVPPGDLTPHGKQQMRLMGDYYRLRYVSAGLLSGRVATDRERIFFRADNDQRTIETARDLGSTLLPEADIDPHARPAGEIDPLFRPAAVTQFHPDRALAVAAVLGRIGGDPANITQANRAAFDTLERVLVGESGAIPPGKFAVADLPAAVVPGVQDHSVTVSGPLQTALSITDVLMLEYAEGMPLEKVGWGRVTPARLTQLIELHSLGFDLAQGTFYPAQVQASNLASHVLATIGQAATGRPDPAAFGTPAQRMVVIVGHDTNIVNLGGLLGLGWWLPGTNRNPVLPGGALVFELRQHASDRTFVVRAFYLSQTLDQMRTLAPLSPDHPPASAPIFIPGCSEAGAGLDAPLPLFETLLRRVIDPRFTIPEPL
jgi:4-phytase / acid phosphatase